MDMPIPPKIKPKLSILPPAMKETSIANLMMNPVKKPPISTTTST